MWRGIPPAGHVGLSDGEASKQVEQGVEVRRADSCQLHVWCDSDCHHPCTTHHALLSHKGAGGLGDEELWNCAALRD